MPRSWESEKEGIKSQCGEQKQWYQQTRKPRCTAAQCKHGEPKERGEGTHRTSHANQQAKKPTKRPSTPRHVEGGGTGGGAEPALERRREPHRVAASEGGEKSGRGRQAMRDTGY